MVAGEKKPFLIALIVPNFSELESFAEERQLNWTTKNDLVELKQVRQIYESLLRNISRQLAAHEKVRKFLLMQDPFTIENGYMTPTLKLKRKSINKTFQKEIDSLYSTMNTLYNSD